MTTLITHIHFGYGTDGANTEYAEIEALRNKINELISAHNVAKIETQTEIEAQAVYNEKTYMVVEKKVLENIVDAMESQRSSVWPSNTTKYVINELKKILENNELEQDEEEDE